MNGDRPDPDGWLSFVDGQTYRRRVNASGTVKVGKKDYYIGRQLKGQLLLLQPTAESRTLTVLLDGQALKWVTPAQLAQEDLLEADRPIVAALIELAAKGRSPSAPRQRIS